jgi:hypothetical protein
MGISPGEIQEQQTIIIFSNQPGKTLWTIVQQRQQAFDDQRIVVSSRISQNRGLFTAILV